MSSKQLLRQFSAPIEKKTLHLDILKRDNDKRIHFYKLSVILFVALNIFISILIIITIYYFTNEGHGSFTTRGVNICLPCEDVRLHPDDIQKTIVSPDENRTQCCIKDERSLDALINFVAAHWFKKNLNLGNPKFTSCGSDIRTLPYIKIIGTTNKQTGNSKNVVDWNNTPAHAHGAISYDNGHITIKETGLYNVYSQVIFQHNTTRAVNTQETPILFTHTVLLKPFGSNDKYEKIVLKSSNSEFECHVTCHNATSYVGTAYQLSNGDQLSVTVHNVSDIFPSSHMNIFGVFMI